MLADPVSEGRRATPNAAVQSGAAIPTDWAVGVSNGHDDLPIPRRTLAGATILQIVPALTKDPAARSAVKVARLLLRAGARALIAAEDGPLVSELTGAGAEWIPLVNDTANPLRLRSNARTIERLIALERIDIVHAHAAPAAFSARLAAAQIAVWVVTTLPDVPPAFSGLRGRLTRALAEGDRIIAPSNYAAIPFMTRYGTRPEQITIVPREIDTHLFDPAAVPTGRAAALRNLWRVPPEVQVVVVPGRVAPWNGQALLPDIARGLVDAGMRDFCFVVVGESTSHGRYARNVLKRANDLETGALLRFVGHFPDMPAAFATADIVAIPAIEPPLLGRVAAQAQAMGRPVVTSNVGVLPEHVVAPPRMPEAVRTGWIAQAGDPVDFARALMLALSLDATAYRAMAARARQFAEYMFSPESVADAMRAVYTSLLAREP
jgi:glycosyltransferase involved in cell wall biosynthesis